MAAYMTATDSLQDLRHGLCYFIPAAVLVYYIIAVTVSTLTLQNLKTQDRKTPRKALFWLVALVLVSYIFEASLLLTDTFANGGRYSYSDINVYTLSNVLVWIVLLGCLDTKSSVWYPQCGTWLITLIAETILLALRLSHDFDASALVYSEIIVQACRLVILISLPTALVARSSKPGPADEESAPLLRHNKTLSANAQSPNDDLDYGSIQASSNDAEIEEEDEDAEDEWKTAKKKKELEDRLLANGNWFTYARSFSMFVPLIWPTKQRLLHLNLIGVFICIACTRALNILQPRQFGIVLDRLSTVGSEDSVRSLALQVFLYVFYGWLSENVLRPIRGRLWLPIQQNASKSLQKAAYNHIMDMSHDFHSDKQSGELYESINQGRSVLDLLKLVLFDVIPVLVDLVVTVSYLYHVFGPYLALILAATTIFHVWSSTYFVSKQAAIHRETASLARKEFQTMYDTVGGWNTVSYFNRIPYEKARYSDIVDSRYELRTKEWSFYYLSDVIEGTFFEFGLLAAGFLAIYQITHSEQPIGSFAMLVSLWQTVNSNIWRLVGTRRDFLENLIDAEALRELFQKDPTIKDGSKSLSFKQGSVHLHDVSFSYDKEKEVIKGFNFYAEPGQRIALVGETGGGKSTILKLLFRFYDAQKGSIMIDEQEIKDVTLESLRNCIGVVPQDPSLFNDTIMQNVRYSKLDASDEEIFEACKAAAIHDKIMQFPKGYASRVGEKGVKLSGGELQRIAIARVILKDPKVILLDEATSAVDTETESRIQEALQKLTRGRTTFTLAHRLSTVADADVILVLKDGSIVEQGPPHELLKAKGKYFDLWSKQVGNTAIPEDDSKPEDTAKLKCSDAGDVKTSSLEDASKSHQGRDKNHSSESSTSSGSKSLRATAPEFVPQKEPVAVYQRGTASKRGQLPHDHGASGHQQHNTSTNAKTNGGKNKSQNDELIDISEQPSKEATLANQTNNGGDQLDDKTKSRNLYQCRRNNKSEPSGSALQYSQLDGPNDRPATSREQSRRVSSPSDPPGGMKRDHGQKRRRDRNWRIKSKSNFTAVRSGTSSGETSSAWSSDTLHPPTPDAPQTTPSDNATPADERDFMGAGRGNVHFAPGV